ncbi:hypothetical protein Goshw_027954, partial [Gossypium schwendimanii]|nr:hypothetical protein [Gossypium schwendimanii]
HIPITLGNLRYLKALDIANNDLSSFLSALANCSDLAFLSFARNPLISGYLPASIGNLSVSLLYFDASSCSISGRIPGEKLGTGIQLIWDILALMEINWKGYCRLLPTEFFQNLKALKEEVGHEYDLLSYSVLLTIKGLELEFKIKVLMPIFTCIDLSDNGFHGEIPKAVGELRLLHALNLSNNCLTGPIPPLRFSNNNLVGPIPSGKQLDTFEDDSYLGNLGLCGLPLPKECNNDEIPERAQDEKGHGNGIAFIWKLAMMGYGCGIVLGISMAYIVFTTGRPQW